MISNRLNEKKLINYKHAPVISFQTIKIKHNLDNLFETDYFNNFLLNPLKLNIPSKRHTND